MDTKKHLVSFRIVFCCIFLFIRCICFGAFGQETGWRVSGTITDQSGRALIGANVIVKGVSGMGTISNIEGKYTIMVPQDATLGFLYIGFEKIDIAVENRSVINVVMKETNHDEPREIKPAEYIDLTWKQRDKASADNGFGFKVFREVSRLEGDNTFFSPFSLNMAMGMLYNGSSGDTRSEMAKILGVANLPESEFNEYYQVIQQDFPEIDPVTEIAIANAMWYNSSIQVKEAFVETGKKYFDTEVRALEFKSPEAAGVINNWCSNKTGGRINNIDINPLQGDIILTNVVYFKSKWQKEKRFNKENTKPDDFIKNDHTKIRVNMMEQTTDLSYYADPNLQCVELPYGNQAFSMIAILPPENVHIDQLIRYLDEVEWNPIVKNLKREWIWLKIPRFRIERELSLNQPLKNAGMGLIFKGGFLNIDDNDDMVVTDVMQKTFVEVNEEGTEAVAVTKVAMLTGAITSVEVLKEPIRFFCDRPFLFLIRERSTGVILFIGRIDDPRE